MDTHNKFISGLLKPTMALLLSAIFFSPVSGAERFSNSEICMADTAKQAITDELSESLNDSIKMIYAAADSINENNPTDKKTVKKKKEKKDWNTWRPNPKRAMWLAIVIPGAGQIYNRKYWKLPIVYGGFVGCLYAMRWNNQMYKDYSQAFMDLMDNDPSTQSYNKFLHLGSAITEDNKERYQNLFKRRKDYYRKYRDLSIFCLVGVYALSVIDAYVDASLSEFDISKDLSLRVDPAILNNGSSLNPLKSSSLGLSCSLTF